MADISNAEFDVLEAIWIEYPATSNQIIERLNQEKNWHEKTVKTLLNRLLKKQAVSYEKSGRSYLYTPLLERSVYTHNESKSLIERMFQGKISPLVASFASKNSLKEDDIAELKKLISKWEKDNG